MDIVLEDYLNSICCGETLPLNRIEYSNGNAPTIEGLETILGFTLLNPIKTGDVITFDNVGYHIPDNAFNGNENIISYDVASDVTAGGSCFSDCTSLTSGFDNLISAADGCFVNCTSLTSGFNNLVTAGNGCFPNCTSLISSFNNLVTAGVGCFVNCTSLTSGFDSLTTAGNSCFVNCTSLTSVFDSLTTAGNSCFSDCTSLTGGFQSLISVGGGCFQNCTSLTILNFDSVDNFGQDTLQNNVFANITGNTITVTAKTIHQTSNGGNLEGDLQYLADNNTVTFIWV
jgi:hypothetical protein